MEAHGSYDICCKDNLKRIYKDQQLSWLQNVGNDVLFVLYRIAYFTEVLFRCSFLHAMRERYQVTGAPYELSKEVKIALGLEKPSAWTLKKLRSIHYKVAEPLILYWWVLSQSHGHHLWPAVVIIWKWWTVWFDLNTYASRQQIWDFQVLNSMTSVLYAFFNLWRNDFT